MAQEYHSKRVRPNAKKETIRADESRLGTDRKSSATFGGANFEHVPFYRTSKGVRLRGGMLMVDALVFDPTNGVTPPIISAEIQ